MRGNERPHSVGASRVLRSSKGTTWTFEGATEERGIRGTRKRERDGQCDSSGEN